MCKYRVTYHSHHRNFSAVCMRTLIFVAIRPLNRQQQRHGRWYPEGGERGCSAAHAAPPARPPLPPRPGSDRGHAQARLTSRERRDQQESPHTGEWGGGLKATPSAAVGQAPAGLAIGWLVRARLRHRPPPEKPLRLVPRSGLLHFPRPGTSSRRSVPV